LKEEGFRMKKTLLWVLSCTLAWAGCATTLDETQSGALGGGALGAGLGAIIGNQTGHTGAGTAIGAGAGALAGALVGEGVKRSKQSAKEEMRQEMQQQQYGPYGQPYQAPAPAYQQPAKPAPAIQEAHTKYNARTGETFPERYKYDPNTGEELQYIR
jgi:hypothetical protein